MSTHFLSLAALPARRLVAADRGEHSAYPAFDQDGQVGPDLCLTERVESGRDQRLDGRLGHGGPGGREPGHHVANGQGVPR
jgi:hypothetical protein